MTDRETKGCATHLDKGSFIMEKLLIKKTEGMVSCSAYHGERKNHVKAKFRSSL